MLEAGLMKFADLMQLDARPRFSNSNRDDARMLQDGSGLPYSDDQKKTRLRSHLSA
jgi:hypothetical protein